MANVAEQETDASVATTGPALSVVRTYNSLDPRTSQATGTGWSSMLDMSLVPDTDGTGALVLTLADGRQVTQIFGLLEMVNRALEIIPDRFC